MTKDIAPGCFSRPRDACNPEPRPGELGTICGFENPEDVEEVPAAGVVLVSEMRAMRGKGGGALAAVPLEGPPVPRRLFPAADGAGERGAGAGLSPVGDPGCTTSPRAETFSPHGITAVPTEFPGVTRVAVVGHRPLREAIELFDLTGTGADARLAWRGCVPLPDATVGNDVAFAADGEIVVSNFVPIMEGLPGLYYVLKGGLGRPTGDLIAWHPEHGWRHIPGTTAPTPNGVAVSADGAVVFYSQTGAGQVARVSRAGGAPEQTSVQGGGLHYQRLYFQDGEALSDKDVEDLINLYRGVPSGQQIMLHCNNGWDRNGQTDGMMPKVLEDCWAAGLTMQQVQQAMGSTGYSRQALHQLDRWESKRTTGKFGK